MHDSGVRVLEGRASVRELEVGKFIVFKIAECLLALPISDVVKVVNCSPATSRELRMMGVVQIGRHAIAVLDLERQFNSANGSELSENNPFLVIARGFQGELCAIAVDKPPDLIELPLELMRPLPRSSHQFPALELVSHAAVLSQEGVTTTIFLLDVMRFPNTGIQESRQLYLKPS